MSNGYYRVNLEEVSSNKSFSLEGACFCMCCQQIIDQQGVGNDFICEKCKLILDRGLLCTIFAELKDILKKNGELSSISNRL